jgi:hypothetical protein
MVVRDLAVANRDETTSEVKRRHQSQCQGAVGLGGVSVGADLYRYLGNSSGPPIWAVQIWHHLDDRRNLEMPPIREISRFGIICCIGSLDFCTPVSIAAKTCHAIFPLL